MNSEEKLEEILMETHKEVVLESNENDPDYYAMNQVIDGALFMVDNTVNPDYKALLIADKAYNLRKLGQLGDGLELLMDEIDSTYGNKTSFGTARLSEELGLYYKAIASDNQVTTILGESISSEQLLENASSALQISIERYERALENPSEEIVSKEEIKDRLHRSYGILSTIYADRFEKDNNNELAEKSIEYAEKEMDARLKNGETGGFGLMNSIHTLGAALSLKPKENYEAANDAFNEAYDMAESRVVKATINFRRTWLEYLTNSEDKERISFMMAGVFKSEEGNINDWDSNVKTLMEKKMKMIGAYLGGETAQRVHEFYREK
jgi:tetratricopeptide (TPR) repeat protein